MTTVLILEDDPLLAELSCEALRDRGYDVVGVAGTVADAVRLASRTRPDAMVCDVRLGGGRSGLEAGRAAMALGGIAVLYVSGADALGLRPGDGHGFLPKPYTVRALCAGIDTVVAVAAGAALVGKAPSGFLAFACVAGRMVAA